MSELEKLLERIRRVEALYARTDVAGEKAAAGHALERILEQLKKFQAVDPPVEFRFSIADGWSRKLFLSLARRYHLEPYRYPGQRRTTVMLRVSRSFLDQTLWPEFEELSNVLHSHLNEITDRIIAESLGSSTSDDTTIRQEHAGNITDRSAQQGT